MDIEVTTAKSLQGRVSVPGDKSISHRALLASALAEGESEISGFLDAADPRSTISCLQTLGADIRLVASRLRVTGNGLRGLQQPRTMLDAGNSGTTMRLLSGILAGQGFMSRLTGDESLRKRPMKRIIDPLHLMGARVDSSATQTAPLTIHGKFPLTPLSYVMQKPSAQVKSAILLAGLFADGVTEVFESVRTRDHTERMLGLTVMQTSEHSKILVEGGHVILPQAYEIPGDISSAIFLIAAATLIPRSDIVISRVGVNPTRRRILDLLLRLGANIKLLNESVVAGEPIADIHVVSSNLEGKVDLEGSDVAELIDEIPILSVTLALSGLPLTVHGGSDLRNKESDRIRAIVTNLRRLGLEVEEYSDGFAFEGKDSLISADCDSFGDHRIAMAFGMAGMVLPGNMKIRQADSVEISFPSFWKSLNELQRN